MRSTQKKIVSFEVCLHKYTDFCARNRKAKIKVGLFFRNYQFCRILETLELLPNLVEALVFASEAPIRIEDIQQCLESYLHINVPRKTLQQTLENLRVKYTDDTYSFELVEIAHGYQFLTKPQYQDLLGTWLKQRSNSKLTKASLETLAVVAYQQPISKGDLERIRGVNCDYAIQKLLEKELIEIKGRSTEVGRPLLYGTSTKFMQHFGIQSMKDLPKLKEFKPEDNEIGDRID